MTGLNLQVGAPPRSEMHLSTLAAGLPGPLGDLLPLPCGHSSAPGRPHSGLSPHADIGLFP